ncbi:hypothetical protein SB717_37750, partial [Priestia sp. SIMBA_032]|uniref:hypothetical protein n=1 Tax=Priestia sp. SIMBA_032 TaxID=3085775 RepID=UPI00397982E2
WHSACAVSATRRNCGACTRPARRVYRQQRTARHSRQQPRARFIATRALTGVQTDVGRKRNKG